MPCESMTHAIGSSSRPSCLRTCLRRSLFSWSKTPSSCQREVRVDRVPVWVVGREIVPGDPGPVYVEDRVQEAAQGMVRRPADVQSTGAALGPPGGQDRLDQLPPDIGQIARITSAFRHWSGTTHPPTARGPAPEVHGAEPGVLGSNRSSQANTVPEPRLSHQYSQQPQQAQTIRSANRANTQKCMPTCPSHPSFASETRRAWKSRGTSRSLPEQDLPLCPCSRCAVSERKPYPNNLSDARWALIEPTLTAWRNARLDRRPTGQPAKVDVRDVFNALLYINRTGIPWKYLPHDFPHHGTVYAHLAS